MKRKLRWNWWKLIKTLSCYLYFFPRICFSQTPSIDFLYLVFCPDILVHKWCLCLFPSSFFFFVAEQEINTEKVWYTKLYTFSDILTRNWSINVQVETILWLILQMLKESLEIFQSPLGHPLQSCCFIFNIGQSLWTYWTKSGKKVQKAEKKNHLFFFLLFRKTSCIL